MDFRREGEHRSQVARGSQVFPHSRTGRYVEENEPRGTTRWASSCRLRQSKTRQTPGEGLSEVPVERIDTGVTRCAEEVYPALDRPGRRLHWPFDDPAAAGGAEAEVLAAFRRVRDAFRSHIAELLGGRRS